MSLEHLLNGMGFSEHTSSPSEINLRHSRRCSFVESLPRMEEYSVFQDLTLILLSVNDFSLANEAYLLKSMTREAKACHKPKI